MVFRKIDETRFAEGFQGKMEKKITEQISICAHKSSRNSHEYIWADKLRKILPEICPTYITVFTAVTAAVAAIRNENNKFTDFIYGGQFLALAFSCCMQLDISNKPCALRTHSRYFSCNFNLACVCFVSHFHSMFCFWSCSSMCPLLHISWIYRCVRRLPRMAMNRRRVFCHTESTDFYWSLLDLHTHKTKTKYPTVIRRTRNARIYGMLNISNCLVLSTVYRS